MVRCSELTWNYNQELDMFPKGPHKKKDTVVVIVDGKSPQTIPTMDTPPEPQKLPRCRLLVILTILLILSLCLLAGYCAWLFFSYEANSSDSVLVIDEEEHQQHTGDHQQQQQQPNHPFKGPILMEDGFSSSVGPSLSDIEKDSFTVNSLDGVSNSDSDFDFLSSSGSSESVYDSSEPYGDSDFSSSISWGDADPYYSDYWPISIEGTTKKSDGYLVRPPKKGFNSPLEFLLQNFRYGVVDPFASDDSSYDAPSWSSGESEGEFRDSYDPNSISSESEIIWDPFSEIEDGSGIYYSDDEILEEWSAEDYSSIVSDWPIDLFSEFFSDAMSYEGSGEYLSSYDDTYVDNEGYIPRPVEPPTAQIDQSPPERIEIAVCNWPKKLFEKEAYRDDGVKIAQYLNSNYDVTSMSTSNVDITQIRSEVNGVLTARTFMRDYSVAIVAVREMIKGPTYSISHCYLSFLTPGLQEDTFGDYSGHGDDDEDVSEGSGTEYELQEFTLEIKNPILLGSDLPIFSTPISKICSQSTKYWATSINILQ